MSWLDSIPVGRGTTLTHLNYEIFESVDFIKFNIHIRNLFNISIHELAFHLLIILIDVRLLVRSFVLKVLLHELDGLGV